MGESPADEDDVVGRWRVRGDGCRGGEESSSLRRRLLGGARSLTDR
jgi:hypothetical protein